MLKEQLAPDGPEPLVRSLGVVGVLFLTLSVTTPASSVFVIAPDMLKAAGTGAIWALLIAGVICVATALVYAELSSAWPVAGGEYVMVARTLGPLAGFVMLGVNVFNNLLFPAVAALGVSGVLAAIVPLPMVPTAIAVVVASTLVSVLHIRVNAWVTGAFLLIELLALLAVTALGFAHAARPVLDMLAHPAASASSIGVATTVAIFALNGYGAAVYFGEEMHEAPAKIAKAVLLSLVLALLFVAAPTMAVLAGAPDLRALFASDDPYGLIVRTLGGGMLANLVAGGVAIAIVNAIIACILATARFFYGTARDRSWGHPLDRWMAAIHPRFGSPWLGTLLIGAVTVALCFLPLSFLVLLSGAGLIAIYAGIALAVLVGRWQGKTGGTGYRMPLYPLAPVVTLIALAYVTWTNWLDLEEGRPALLVTLGQMGGSALYYWLVLARRGPWEVTVPD